MRLRLLLLPAALLLALAVLLWPQALRHGSGPPEPAPSQAPAGAPAGGAPPARHAEPPEAALAAAQALREAPRPSAIGGAHAPLARALQLREQADGTLAERPLRDAESPLRLRMIAASALLFPRGEPFEIAGVRHVPVEVRKQGLPFLNRGGRVHEGPSGLLGMAGGVAFPPLEEPRSRIARDEAVAAALEDAEIAILRATPTARLGWLAIEGRSVLAWDVVVPSRAPLGTFRVVLDAGSGEVLRRADLLRTHEGLGRVYPKDPKQTPRPDLLPLLELDDSGWLSGRITRILDHRAADAMSGDATFVFSETDPRFVQTSVYRGLTETALFAEAHGFPPIEDALLAHVNLADPESGGEFNNAFYDPWLRQFGFGNGDGEVLANLGVDLDVAAHEMGHHVFETLVEPWIFSVTDPALAMHEGVADTFSLLVGGDPRMGDSVVPGARFLRSLRNKRRFPNDASPSPHETGLIYGGTSEDLRKAFKPAGLATLLITALPFIPPDPVETDYRDAFLQADQLLTEGRRTKKIRSVFRKRGFDKLDLPDEFQGFLQPGVPRLGALDDGEFHLWIFGEFPPAATIDFRLSGAGDADLVVMSAEHGDPKDPTTFAVSQNFLTSNERVTLTKHSTPSVDLDDVWVVAVFDYEDGGPSIYSLEVTVTLPADQITVDGPPVDGSIDEQGQIDFYLFSGEAGQIVSATARRLSGSVDPLVAVLDFEAFDVLGADDDSGGGVDAHIKGALLPATGRYLVAVLSLVADVDPRVGTGAYELELSTCVPFGPDTDGDGIPDVCDDDSDGDGFIDSIDVDPLDPFRCADLDFDGCDDCSSGVFDPWNDGPDNDGDGICDLGDPDDDNDGCPDEIDPFPFTWSHDDDADGIGADCDNCPEVPNPGQEDTNLDGVGDACSFCSRVAWSEPAQIPPDQNPLDARVRITRANQPGRTQITASGLFNPTGILPLDPSASGALVHLADWDGPLLHLNVPPGLVGSSSCDPRDGWSQKSGKGGSVLWQYANRSGALDPPFCTPGSAAGLRSLTLEDRRASFTDAVVFKVAIKNADLGRPPADPVRFVQLALVLDNEEAYASTTPAGALGKCTEAVLRLGGQHSDCKVKRAKKSHELQSLDCRSD
jgi:hypothetical protein